LTVDAEGSAILILPVLECLAEVRLDFRELFGNALSLLLLTQQLAGIAPLTLLSLRHQTRGILAALFKVFPVLDETSVSVDDSENGRALLLQHFETGDLLLVGRQKSVRKDIGERRRKFEHLLLGKVQAVPELLELEPSIFDEEVKILVLELSEAGKLIFEFVDLSKAASSVGSQELFALGLIDTKAVP
jgi:hypothetical protein